VGLRNLHRRSLLRSGGRSECKLVRLGLGLGLGSGLVSRRISYE